MTVPTARYRQKQNAPRSCLPRGVLIWIRLQQLQLQRADAEKDCEKQRIDPGKAEEIPPGAAGVGVQIGTQSDEARHGRNERPHPADIHPEQERAPVRREPREENRRRHIGDHLARQRRDEKRVPGEERREELPDGGDSHHVPGEDEEAHEREEQRIIHVEKRAPVGNEKHKYHRRECRVIREQTKDRKDDEQKSAEIHPRAYTRQGCRRALPYPDRLPREKDKAQNGDDCHGDKERREHRQRKRPCRNAKIAVEIQVLRVAERCQHSAEVGGGILENERECHVALFSRRGQDIAGQRQKGKERHIVRNQHGTDEGDIRQGKHTGAERARQRHNPLREDGEETDVPQRRHDGERRKQAGQRGEINIRKVRLIGRNEESRHQRCRESDK